MAGIVLVGIALQWWPVTAVLAQETPPVERPAGAATPAEAATPAVPVVVATPGAAATAGATPATAVRDGEDRQGDAAREEPDGGWPTFRVNLFADLTRTAGDLFTRSLVALFQGIADAARRIVEGVMGSSINFITQTPPSVSYDSPTVRGLWATVRGIANAGLALVALWGGFNLMAREHLGAPYHAAMELFPRIVIAALLVNTSLWWAQLAIDANNALCLAFGQVSLPAWEDASSGAQAFANVLVAVVYLITALLLVLQMLMRLALVDVLLVLAPLALLCWVLPQTQSWCQLWTSTFTGTVFTQLVQVVTLKLGGLLLTEFTPMTAETGLVSLFLAVALMALAIKIPGLMHGRLGDGLSFARYYAYRRAAQVVGGGSNGSGGRGRGGQEGD